MFKNFSKKHFFMLKKIRHFDVLARHYQVKIHYECSKNTKNYRSLKRKETQKNILLVKQIV